MLAQSTHGGKVRRGQESRGRGRLCVYTEETGALSQLEAEWTSNS